MNVKELFDYLKPIAIYQGGSSVLLKEYNDIDIFVYYQTKQEARNALENFNMGLVEQGYNIHFTSLEAKDIFCDRAVNYPFVKRLEGEEIDFSVDFSQHKEDIKHLIDTSLEKSKRWYRILAMCYMIGNGENTLTKQQLNTIQKAHDEKKISEYLKSYCLRTLLNV